MEWPRNRMTLAYYLTVAVGVLALWIYCGRFGRSQPLPKRPRANVKMVKWPSAPDSALQLKTQHKVLLPTRTGILANRQNSVDHNVRSGRRRCRQRAGICRETFLYLVQGEDNPCPFWVDVTRRTDSFLIWLSWRRPSNWSESEDLGWRWWRHV